MKLGNLIFLSWECALFEVSSSAPKEEGKWASRGSHFPSLFLNYFEFPDVTSTDMSLVIEWVEFLFWALGLIDG